MVLKPRKQRCFSESHDPKTMSAPSYRCAVFAYDETQRQAAVAAQEAYQAVLSRAGYGPITTEVRDAPAFYYAEPYHQQYLAKNPEATAAPAAPESPARSGRSVPPRGDQSGAVKSSSSREAGYRIHDMGCARDWRRPCRTLCSIVTTTCRRLCQRDRTPDRSPGARHCRPNTITA